MTMAVSLVESAWIVESFFIWVHVSVRQHLVQAIGCNLKQRNPKVVSEICPRYTTGGHSGLGA
jgi:hypothetical protein